MKKVKLGEIFTIERDSNGGVPYSYYLAKLDSGLALLDYGVKPIEPVHPGSPTKVYFVFQAIKEGKTGYQLAKFRVFDISDILYEEVQPVEVVNESNAKSNIVGGWSPFEDLDAEDKKVFKEALEGFIGVDYKPLKVSKQIVNGVNYRYICDAKGVYPGAVTYKAMVSIHKPIGKKAYITDIHKID